MRRSAERTNNGPLPVAGVERVRHGAQRAELLQRGGGDRGSRLMCLPAQRQFLGQAQPSNGTAVDGRGPPWCCRQWPSAVAIGRTPSSSAAVSDAPYVSPIAASRRGRCCCSFGTMRWFRRVAGAVVEGSAKRTQRSQSQSCSWGSWAAPRCSGVGERSQVQHGRAASRRRRSRDLTACRWAGSGFQRLGVPAGM